MVYAEDICYAMLCYAMLCYGVQWLDTGMAVSDSLSLPRDKSAVPVPAAGVALVVPDVLDLGQARDVEAVPPVEPRVGHAVVVADAVLVYELVGLDVVAPLAGAARSAQVEVQQVLRSQLNVKLVASRTVFKPLIDTMTIR
jgi:hypothetical protein